MSFQDELSALREELQITRACLEQVRAAAERATVPTFIEVLDREHHRCQRYNHYFSLVVASSSQIGAAEMLKRLLHAVRSSDVLGMVDEEGRYHVLNVSGEVLASVYDRVTAPGKAQVGIILPETDRGGAQAALDRMSSNLSAAEQVRMGLAVYPDDSTSVPELIRLAAG